MELFNFLKKYECYLVGGAIRDFILKKEIKDIDLVILTDKKKFLEIIKVISKKINIFPLDIERVIYRINIDGLTIDISNSTDIKQDLIKRDFTINSLGVEFKKVKIGINKSFKINIDRKHIIDISNGLKDIKTKKLKIVYKNAFNDDPLRILRAYRFYSQGFDIDKNVERLITINKHLIKDVSKERVKDELIKIFETNNTYQTLKKMLKSGVLFEIFPILKLQTNCAQVYYGKGGVLKHTFNVVQRTDILYSNPKKYLNISPILIKKMNEEKYLIKLTALLHDIAKPHKAKIIENRLRFFGHEQYGGLLAQKILKDLRFSNNDIKYITTIISNHLRIGNIAHNDIISNKAMLRIFYDLKDYTLGLLLLSWADYSSYISSKKLNQIINKIKEKPFPITRKLPKTGIRKTIRFLQTANMIISNFKKYTTKATIKPIIDGNTIMKELNLKSGPIVGKILKKIIDLQLEEKITDAKQAISYIKNININALK